MRNIGIVAENSIEYVRIFTSILEQKKTAVLIDWRLPDERIKDIARELDIAELFCDESIGIRLSKLNGLKDKISTIYRQNTIEKIPDELSEKWKTIGRDYSENIAVILFSSGTTGNFKGIRLSYRAINNNSDSIIDYLDRQNIQSILISKSFAHSSTIVGEVIVALKLRLQIYVTKSLTQPKDILNFIQLKKIDMYCINPSLLYLIALAAKQNVNRFPELRYLYVSGSVCSKDILVLAQNVFKYTKILNAYGLTELGPRVTAQSHVRNNNLGSVGFPIKNVYVEVISKDGAICRVGEVGILHVKSNSLMSGYCNGECTRKSLYRGWFNTGDLGYKTLEGEIFVIGRNDNMIICSGHNIYPETIEQVIEMMDEVEECIVFGEKEILYGEQVVCHYTLKDKDASRIDKSEIIDFCKKYLASYEIPQKIVCVQSIEKTASGKKSRNNL